MPRIRIITDVPRNEVDFCVSLIESDGGTCTIDDQGDGRCTIVGTIPGEEPAAETPAVAESPEAKWLAVAQAEIGTKEAAGGADNPRIVEYHKSTLGERPDSVPWCSSFVNFCVERAGFRGTKSAVARSWANWGHEAPELAPGCVVVLSRGNPPKGHVGFYVGRDGERIRLLGGNQGDAVCIASFDADRIVAKRTL